MKTTWKLLHILILVSASHSLAVERREFYYGTRQMGMGGVVVATVNDETALLANPAALGKLRGPYITVADPEADGSTNNYGIMTKNGGDSTAFTEPQTLLDKLNQSPDKYFHFMGQASPSFVSTNFGVGVFAKYLYDGEVITDTSKFDYYYRNDIAAVVGFNFRIWDGRIKFGFNGKVINRVEADKTGDNALPSNSTGLQLKNLVTEGVGLGSDAGLIITGPWVYLPSIAAVWHDVGSTSFELNDGMLYDTSSRPKPQASSLDVGFSVSPIIGNRFRLQIAGEYRDVMTSGDEVDQMRRVHAGIEFNIADTLFLRAGMNQRYWTAGFEFATSVFQIQAASYGEEIGTATATVTTPREDRRYMGKVAIRF